MAVNTRKLKRVGEKIRKLRKGLGWTQQTLAEKVRVTPTYIGFIEQAQRNPSIKTADKIARALKIKIDELFR